MRKIVALILLISLAGLASASQNEYMTLSWNQSTKEVISALAVGDYDGDGTKEVAASASSEGVVYCFSNNGKLEWKLEAPSYLFTVKTVDVTGDGRVELAVGGGQHLYIVNGSGETVWKHYTGNNPVRRIEGFDADGDGGSDLVYGTFKDECDDTYVSAVDENGSSLWNYGLGVYYPNVLKSVRVSGGVDWILVGTVYRAKDTARKSCGPAYNAPASVLLLDSGRQLVWDYKTVGGATVIETADLNGDGKQEILVGTYPTLYALDLYGKMLWNYTTVNLVDSLAVGDLNGDGVPEVVVGSNDAYVLDANGMELAVAKTEGRVYTLRIADLNGDNRSEIVAGSNGVYVFNYKGEKLYQSDKVVSVGDLEVADLDGDGYAEVAAGAVKSVRLYSTGFQSKQQKAEAFYNLAKDYYTKGDFDNAMAYIEKARKAFLETGDLKSVSAALTFRDRINQTRLGGAAVSADDIPALSADQQTFFDSIYGKLSSLGNASMPRANLWEAIKSRKNALIILATAMVVVILLLFAIVLLIRWSGRRRAGMGEEDAPAYELRGESIIGQPPAERFLEKTLVKHTRENKRFIKSSEKRAGMKI